MNAGSAERTRDLLRSVLAATPDGVMVFRGVRASGAIVDFEWVLINARGLAILNKTGEDLIGRRLLEVFPGNREAGLLDAYIAVVETGERFETVVPYRHDGLYTSFRLVAVPLGSDDGVTVTFEDVIDVVAGEVYAFDEGVEPGVASGGEAQDASGAPEADPEGPAVVA